MPNHTDNRHETGSAGVTRPSAAYLFTLAIGCAGLPFLGIGLGGSLIGRSGGDPTDAFDVDGMVMFLLGYGVIFAMRLIFWQRAPVGLRAAVRMSISALLALAIPVSIVAVILAWHLPATLPHRTGPQCFSVLALLCQVASIVWLLRYRQEGL